jgi:hypothetical protein
MRWSILEQICKSGNRSGLPIIFKDLGKDLQKEKL